MIIKAIFQMMHLKTPLNLMKKRKLVKRQVNILMIMKRVIIIMMRTRIKDHEEDRDDDDLGMTNKTCKSYKQTFVQKSIPVVLAIVFRRR